MICAESIQELLGKMNTLKCRNAEMEKNGLRMNLRKTNILAFDINMGLPNKPGMDPCSVLQTGLGGNAIFSGGCLCWWYSGPVAP